VLVLNGNGADVAKHCVPEVPTKRYNLDSFLLHINIVFLFMSLLFIHRISITFRKMDESKWPVWYTPEPYLQGIQPLTYELKSCGSSDHVF